MQMQMRQVTHQPNDRHRMKTQPRKLQPAPGTQKSIRSGQKLVHTARFTNGWRWEGVRGHSGQQKRNRVGGGVDDGPGLRDSFSIHSPRQAGLLLSLPSRLHVDAAPPPCCRYPAGSFPGINRHGSESQTHKVFAPHESRVWHEKFFTTYLKIQ